MSICQITVLFFCKTRNFFKMVPLFGFLGMIVVFEWIKSTHFRLEESIKFSLMVNNLYLFYGLVKSIHWCLTNEAEKSKLVYMSQNLANEKREKQKLEEELSLARSSLSELHSQVSSQEYRFRRLASGGLDFDDGTFDYDGDMDFVGK